MEPIREVDGHSAPKLRISDGDGNIMRSSGDGPILTLRSPESGIELGRIDRDGTIHVVLNPESGEMKSATWKEAVAMFVVTAKQHNWPKTFGWEE